MLDFGYTPEALLNNIELTGADPAKINAMVVSHGHFDHYGGLVGFLRNIATCCRPTSNSTPAVRTISASDMAAHPPADRIRRAGPRELVANQVSVVLAESRRLSPNMPSPPARSSGRASKKVLPNTQVEFAIKDGLGCNAGHYLPAEMLGKIVPDEHLHEHATCFNVKDRGLVVISSCGHVGIVNSVRQAQEVSGVQKVHAIVGGFHLGPAPEDYLNQVVAEIKKLNPTWLSRCIVAATTSLAPCAPKCRTSSWSRRLASD